ncbi:hypothetical protein BC831DRAFT_463659 [Entophlyctis helioformis]|nr:hypothetical protein BC831DRAFT_463659 [Entophlyctis helioformis]
MAQYAHAPAHGHAHAHAPAPAPLHPPHQPPPYQHHSPYQQHLPYHPQQQQHPHPQHAQTQQAHEPPPFQKPLATLSASPGSGPAVLRPLYNTPTPTASSMPPSSVHHVADHNIHSHSHHPQQHHQHQHHQQHQQQQQKQHYSSTPAQHAASPAPAPAPGAQSHTDQTVAAAVAAHQQHAQADASSSQASGSAPRRAGQFLARMALSVPHATHIGSLSAADRTQLAHYLPASMTQLIAESFAFKRQRHLPEPIHSSVRSIQQQLLPHGAKDSTLAQEEELLLLQELRPVRYANVKCGEHIHEWLRHPDVQAWTVMDFIQIYSNALNRIWRWLYKMKLVSNSVTNAAGTIVQFIGRPPGAGQQPHNPLAHAQRHAHGHAAAATGSSSSTSVSGSAEPHSPSYLDEASHLNGHAGYHHPQDDDDDLGDMGDMDGRDPAQ